MEFFSFSPMETAVLTLVVVGMMFVLFLREAFPTEVVAIAGAALLLAIGVLIAAVARPASGRARNARRSRRARGRPRTDGWTARTAGGCIVCMCIQCKQ